ncbi:MAG: DUF3343 domain-containing protein [Clostridia bacterium]|nr:DUF3343 domain-containing protein [Clostridia bacterium]
MNYVATFYTHAAALMTNRTLNRKGIPSRLGPVPRALSSSCGTCVMYTSDDPHLPDMDRDVEGVYVLTESDYTELLKNE